MLSAEPGTGRPGRRRSQESRHAILAATMSLLEQVGVRRLTFDAVAAEAGVGKSTIYRWWHSKGTLALDAFEQKYEILSPPRAVKSVGSLREDLYELLRPIHETIALQGPDRVWRQILAEAQSDKLLAAVLHARLVEPYREMQRPVIESAVARGEVGPGFDFDLLMDTLYGAYYHRMLFHHGALDREFFNAIVDMVLDGAGVSPKA